MGFNVSKNLFQAFSVYAAKYMVSSAFSRVVFIYSCSICHCLVLKSSHFERHLQILINFISFAAV